MKDQFTANILGIPKIKNGSKIEFGRGQKYTVLVDQHFNWFQKRMIKWCFGFNVSDYSEE